MSSRTSQAVTVSKKKKPKAKMKGIIRKSDNGRNILIIINNKVYFISFTAIQNVWKGSKEQNPILGY